MVLPQRPPKPLIRRTMRTVHGAMRFFECESAGFKDAHVVGEDGGCVGGETTVGFCSVGKVGFGDVVGMGVGALAMEAGGLDWRWRVGLTESGALTFNTGAVVV